MQRSASGRGLRGASTGAGGSSGYHTPNPAGISVQPEGSSATRPDAPKGSYYLTQDEEPLGPYAAIANTQACMTSFPSRLRLGTTTLMQPATTQEKEARKPVSTTLATASTSQQAPQQQQQQPYIPSEYGLGRRAKSQVNYSEVSQFEFEEEDKDQSPAPESGLTARGRALAQRKAREESSQPPAASTSQVPSDRQSREEAALNALHAWIPPRSYLDIAPPGHLVLVEPARKTRHLYAPQHVLEAKARSRSCLVPIRLELDTEGHKIRDQFVWNTKEESVTPEHFAAIFCEDLGLPESFRRAVSQSIRQQLEEHTSIAEISLEPDLPDTVHTPPDRIEADPDLRVILSIDVQLGMLRLVDKLEWDLGSPHSPDLVARTICADLALPSEAGPTIAHAIHEEILRAKRECVDMGLLGDQIHLRGAKKLEGVWREWSDTMDFGPRIEAMDWDELERYEKDKERASKRAKRHQVTSGARRRR